MAKFVSSRSRNRKSIRARFINVKRSENNLSRCNGNYCNEVLVSRVITTWKTAADHLQKTIHKLVLINETRLECDALPAAAHQTRHEQECINYRRK